MVKKYYTISLEALKLVKYSKDTIFLTIKK